MNKLKYYLPEVTAFLTGLVGVHLLERDFLNSDDSISGNGLRIFFWQHWLTLWFIRQ